MSVVLAKEGIVGRDEANNGLLALMANIDTYKHSFLGYLFAEAHTPQIATELRIDLPHYVHIDAVVVFLNNLTCHKLRDHWVV